LNANLYPVNQGDEGLFEKVGKNEHPNAGYKGWPWNAAMNV